MRDCPVCTLDLSSGLTHDTHVQTLCMCTVPLTPLALSDEGGFRGSVCMHLGHACTRQRDDTLASK